MAANRGTAHQSRPWPPLRAAACGRYKGPPAPLQALWGDRLYRIGGSRLRTRRSCTIAGPWGPWLLPQEAVANATSASNMEGAPSRDLDLGHRAMRLSVARGGTESLQAGRPLARPRHGERQIWQGRGRASKASPFSPGSGSRPGLLCR